MKGHSYCVVARGVCIHVSGVRHACIRGPSPPYRIHLVYQDLASAATDPFFHLVCQDLAPAPTVPLVRCTTRAHSQGVGGIFFPDTDA